VATEVILVVALEVVPGAQRGRVLDPIEEQLAAQVIDLVLVGPGGHAGGLEVEAVALAVEGLDSQAPR